MVTRPSRAGIARNQKLCEIVIKTCQTLQRISVTSQVRSRERPKGSVPSSTQHISASPQSLLPLCQFSASRALMAERSCPLRHHRASTSAGNKNRFIAPLAEMGKQRVQVPYPDIRSHGIRVAGIVITWILLFGAVEAPWSREHCGGHGEPFHRSSLFPKPN